MKKNMGSTDRIIRIILSAILIYLSYSGTVTGTAGVVLMVLAVIFLLTSLVSFCPLYTIFGISTSKPESGEKKS